MNLPSPETPVASDERPIARRRVGRLVFGGVAVLGIAIAVTCTIYRRVEALPKGLPADEFRIGLNAPYITTAQVIADQMVEVAELTADDVVYDLGCGDGRLLITAAVKHGCRGVGIDLDPERVAEAKANARLQGVEDLVEFREQDVFTVELREADVVFDVLAALDDEATGTAVPTDATRFANYLTRLWHRRHQVY